MRRDFTIRDATETDLVAVKACLAETWHATYDDIFGRDQVTAISARWHSLDALRRHLATPNANFLVATAGARVIGTASARLVEPGHVSLQWLYVTPDAQGDGCGQRLMEAAIGGFDTIKRVTLDVEPRNARAIVFYQRQGFRQIGLEEREHAGSVEMAAVFEKIMQPA